MKRCENLLIKLKEAIIVEGKYDKIKLSQLVDTIIIDVCGFNIYKNKEKVNLIKRLANTNGIIILTDSDHAGFMIRNYLKGIISEHQMRHVYIPDIFGKEKRKKNYSKEGKLGVEGIPNDILKKLLEKLATKDFETKPQTHSITKLDFFNYGLSGGNNSTQKRKNLLKKLDLPEHLSQNEMIKVLNEIISYDEFLKLLKNL